MIYIYIYIYISHTWFSYAGACGLERGRRFCGFRIRDWSGGGGEEGAVTQLVAWVATLVAYYWCCRCILHFFSFSLTPFQCSSQQQLKITHMYFPFFFFFFFFWLSVFKHLLLFFFFFFPWRKWGVKYVGSKTLKSQMGVGRSWSSEFYPP